MVSLPSANAADLGGNCCADLEERVAELEATTARKGNRKVSLTVSGWVAQSRSCCGTTATRDNIYVRGLGTTLGHERQVHRPGHHRPRLDGRLRDAHRSSTAATCCSAIEPGHRLTVPALYTGTTATTCQTLQSFWFIKSDHWGKVSVGLQSQASDNTAILVDGSGSPGSGELGRSSIIGGFQLRACWRRHPDGCYDQRRHGRLGR